MTNGKIKATLFAVLAAAFYALNVPFSKLLLKDVPLDIYPIYYRFHHHLVF